MIMKKIKLEPIEGQSPEYVKISNDEQSHTLFRKKKKKLKIQDSEVSTTAEIKPELTPPIDRVKAAEPVSNNISDKLSDLWLNYKPRSTTLIKSGCTWFEQLIQETHEEKEEEIDHFTQTSLKDLASKILAQDAENYKKNEERNNQRGDMNFRKTVYNVGTFRDKLAAHVLRCMESPAHSLHNLNSIISMISPKAKNEFDEALDSVMKLLDFTLLPETRVARKFEDHKFSCLLSFLPINRQMAEKQLALWYFEDQLLYAYLKLVSQLSQVTSSTVDNTKITGIKSLVRLVTSHPGQDREIVLETVVNKLGDPSRKVASQTMYSLHRFLQQNRSMKETVVNLVEILLYRPNVTPKTQYFSLCYLKDIIFEHKDNKLAAKLLKLYIGFFKACTKKGEVDSRMMAALLRGINRAFPFSQLKGDALQEQLETLYKLSHVVNFAVATQALQIIYQVVTSRDHVEDRFYQALYCQLQDPAFGTSSGNAAFLNLIFKAMMRDLSLERRQAFVKRLLQVAQYQDPHIMCGMLFLISEVSKEKQDMKEAIQAVLQQTQTVANDEDDFETFEDAADEDNDDDVVIKEESELGEKDNIKEKPNYFKKYLDENNESSHSKGQLSCITAPSSSSWFHCANTNDTKVLKRKVYDPYLRNPQYCGAHFTSLWELLFLQVHYHPSVALFSEKIISGELIEYTGDPLQDFTLIRFLDRFVYKNPKKDTEKMNPDAIKLGSQAYYVPDGARGIPVNSDDFIKLDGDQVPEDEIFFHSYFTKFKSESKKVKDDDIDSDVDDDEFDSYLNKMNGIGSEDSDIDEDIDFSAGTSNIPKGSKKDSEESDEDFGGSDDEEPVFEKYSDGLGEDDEFGNKENDMDFGSDEDGMDFGNNDDEMDFDEENIAFSDDDDFDSKPAKIKGKSKKRVKNESDSLESMFASADDFAHLLEENADESAGLPTATSKELANKDRAHIKQLNWEADRDDRIHERGRYGNRGWKKRGQNRPYKGSGGRKNFKNSNAKGSKKFNFNSKKSFKAKRGRRK